MRIFKKTMLAAGVMALIATIATAVVFFLNPLWINDLTIRFHLRTQHVLSQYTQVDSYRIHYFEALPAQEAGKFDSSDHPLVLIHGLGSHGEDWSSMVPTLAAQGFHVYALDLLGYGRSSRPDVDYSIALESQTVVDFMRKLNLQHADVAGWSMGGWIALRVAIDHPAMVDHLVVYDSAGIYFPPTFDASLFIPRDSAGLIKLTSMLSPAPRPMPVFVQRAALRKLRSSAWVISRSLASMGSGRDLVDFQLHKIEAPVLIVWGKQDTIIPPSVAQTMHHNIRGSSLLLLDGCGHLAPAECTRPVLAATISFLRASTPTRAGEFTVAGQ